MEGLINWYQEHFRCLPWRNTKDPYKIWLSEIILQQTRVDQGLPYYNRFIDTFPTVYDLAAASIDEVLLLWQGLGYYSRARNLHYTACNIVNEFNGMFPSDTERLKRLKGIGDYTAAAIASFAFNVPEAVVDGNVFRVISRFYNEEAAIDTSEGKKRFKELAQLSLDRTRPGLHNQAIMELGATVCTPQNPECYRCPLEAGCLARKEKTINELPVKSKKITVKNRYFMFLILASDKTLVIQKREGKDIWKGLYQFPLFEFEKSPKDEDLIFGISSLTGKSVEDFSILFVRKQPCHKLSHQHIHPIFVCVKHKGDVINNEFLEIKKSDFNKYAFPRIITRYLEQYEAF